MPNVRLHRGILAVDFDNTIARVPNFPVIEGLIPFAKPVLQKLYERGWFIIINTCRSGKRQHEAIEFLKAMDIPFSIINANHPWLIEVFGEDCRKISADIYIDDKNIENVTSGNITAIDWLDYFEKIIDFEFNGESMLNLCKNIQNENI